jgi:hypothetical protein
LLQLSLLMYFATEVLSLIWSLNKPLGINYLGNLAPLAYITVAFCLFKLDKSDFELIIQTAFRFSMIYIFITFCCYIIQSRFLNFNFTNNLLFQKYTIAQYSNLEVLFAWSNFKHPTYIAINLIFSLSAGWYYVNKKNIQNNISYLEMALMVLGTLIFSIISSSRFMLVAWTMINTLGYIYVIRKRKMILIPSLALIVVLGTIGFMKNTEKLVNFSNDIVRSSLQKAAYEGIKEKTWQGTGLGGMTHFINYENPILTPLQIDKNNFNHFHPHNQFIGDLLQTGILGIISILFIIFAMFYTAYKQSNWLLFINTVFFILLMNIEMPLVYTKGILSFVLTFSLLTSIKKDNYEESF